MHSEPRASDFELADVEVALLRSAAGDHAAEASLLLMAHAGHWLPELAAAGLIAADYDDAPSSPRPDCPPRVGWAAVIWIDVDAAVRTGRIVGSGGQLRILRAAASLADGQFVDLGDIASGLDRRHLVLLLAAIAHAGSRHEHYDELRDVDDGVTSLGDRMPPVLSWPARD